MEHTHARIRYNIPDSGYFGCVHVDGSIKYDKAITSLSDKDIKIFKTYECFLKEYRCNNYFRVTISKVTESQIIKYIPIILDVIEKSLE